VLRARLATERERQPHRELAAVGELRRRLEAVLHEQLQVVALVQDADIDVGIALTQPPRFSILLGHELLVQRRDLDEEVVGRQKEVGCECLSGTILAVPLQRERARLVLPCDAVEVEELRELPLGVVCETDLLVRKLLDVDDGSPIAPPRGASYGRRA